MGSNSDHGESACIVLWLNFKINLCLEIISLAIKVRDAHRESVVRIAAFHTSLYEQRHAFHFRKVREWLDYSEVGFSIYDTYFVLGDYTETALARR